VALKLGEYNTQKEEEENRFKLGDLLSNSVQLNNLSRVGKRIDKMFKVNTSSSLSSIIKDDIPSLDK
jgi:hypothetical protein